MLLISKYKISGHSMEPNIIDKSTVFISSLPYLLSMPKKNDIIVFEKNSKHFLKRIQKISKNKYFVKCKMTSSNLFKKWKTLKESNLTYSTERQK
jgi:signal peptidase I